MVDGLPTFDRSPLVERDRSPTTAIVEVMASVSNTRIEELPPLYDAVDPELLDRIFDRSSVGLVAFQYNGHVVSLDADRTVAVYES